MEFFNLHTTLDKHYDKLGDDLGAYVGIILKRASNMLNWVYWLGIESSVEYLI
jgi:hypothetical protein